MYILKQGPRPLGLDEPIRHESSHKRPVRRRDFIGQGFMAGGATVMAPTLLGLLGSRRALAQVQLSPDIAARKLVPCNIIPGAGKIPFIAFDLAGGASMVGSEILMGGPGGQLDFLTTAGYAKLGLPGDQVPNAPNAASATNNFIDTRLGAAWHSDGAFLRGMMTKISPAAAANTNACVIAARSENDTGNNPHNPMYGIAKYGLADGDLMALIGSRNSDSGGNSLAPMMMVDLAIRPTKIDRTSDVTGLVDTGKLGELFTDPQDVVSVLESMTRLSDAKLGRVSTRLPAAEDQALKEQVACNFVATADVAARFSSPGVLNPELDPRIKGAAGIFTDAEFDSDGEFEKTAAVMKLVIDGFAGAGTVTMGGYDYHGQGRATGETRNFRAGQCMGACIEYAHRTGKPLMLYVFSDGSLSANGQVDNTANGRGKFMWASDNQSTAASFFLVYSPNGRPTLLEEGGIPTTRRQQIGYYTPDGSVATASSPAANAVNLLVDTVILNYMQLHGEFGQFASRYPGNGLGSQAAALRAFNPIVNGTI
jgi:hypothetical protein